MTPPLYAWRKAGLILLALLWPVELAAQASNVIRIDSISANAPDIGRVVSSVSGDTVFRASAADGSVTRLSGTGTRLGGGSTRALVTVSCSGGVGQCNNASTLVTVTAAGSTGRARPLTAFTVAPGPNPPTIRTVGGLGTPTLTFVISDIPRGGSRDFYIGADFTVRDNSSGPSGAATAGFSVAVAANAMTGQATASVLRPLFLAKNSDLVFGSIIRPTAGTSTVSINPATGQRAIAGADGHLLPGTTSRASFTVTGEGGQVVAVSVPSSFVMTGQGSLIVATSSSAGATATLSAAPGSAGLISFGVGGTLPVTSSTPAGHYSGTFAVTVYYN